MLSAEVYVKHENHQPTASFKVRGQINVISRLSEDAREKGVIVASTGNDAQAVAYASKLFHLRATVVMPEHPNPMKVEMTRGLGASVILHGKGFEQAKNFAESLARKKGFTYIHSANEPNLIAGAGTLMLEIIEDLPDVDAVFVPVGGGACASGVCLVAKSLNERIQTFGVQSSESPAAYTSWKKGRIVSARNETFAEGLATGEGYELPLRILRKALDDFVLVSDDEILGGMRLMIGATRNLAEPASASTLSAAMKLKANLKGRKVALVLTGGNASMEQLMMALKHR